MQPPRLPEGGEVSLDGSNYPEPGREASRSASRASEDSMPAACSRSMAVDRIWATSALVQVVGPLEHRSRLSRGPERELTGILERLIRPLQVPGEGLHRESEPQDRLGELSGRGSFLAHQRDGSASQHPGIAHGEVK